MGGGEMYFYPWHSFNQEKNQISFSLLTCFFEFTQISPKLENYKKHYSKLGGWGEGRADKLLPRKYKHTFSEIKNSLGTDYVKD